MTVTETLKTLESLGTAQNRKVYARHGAPENQYGVSFANLQKLQKRIRVDQSLALGLWKSGNGDARILATMIAEPAKMTEKILDGWVGAIRYYVLADAVASLAIRTTFARGLAERWIREPAEFVAQAGWSMVARLSMQDRTVPEAYFEKFLPRIARTIDKAENRARYAMNNALIAIGSRSDDLERQALAVAKAIGPVEVDHGDTGCKTPDAVPYIKKSRAHRRTKG
jgi:3-methyladenine DNA glycosylase AlkD